MSEKICCIFGDRRFPEEKIRYVKKRLEEEIVNAILDGYTGFISGMSHGAELIFAQLVTEKMADNSAINLRAIIPYPSQNITDKAVYIKCLNACKQITIQQAKYTAGCFLTCNRRITALSDRIIFVSGNYSRYYSLAYTKGYSKAIGKEVREIVF